MARPEIHERHDVFKGAAADESRIAAAADPIANPEGAFERPSAVIDDPDLTLDEKLTALQNWDAAVRRRLAAESSAAAGGVVAGGVSAHEVDLLEDIERARVVLRHGHGWSPAAAAQDPAHAETEVITPTEARQASPRRMNFRILERSLLLAAIAAAALYLWFYFA